PNQPAVRRLAQRGIPIRDVDVGEPARLTMAGDEGAGRKVVDLRSVGGVQTEIDAVRVVQTDERCRMGEVREAVEGTRDRVADLLVLGADLVVGAQGQS